MAKDEKKSIVEEAKERYERAKDVYSRSRQLSIEDTRFALGDSDNGWQWPDEIRRARKLERKVCLTVNMTAQHCNQIINNMRQNRPQVRVLPVDSGADKKTAEILGGLIRNIQVSSNADDAHDVAAEHSIYGGEGYWRIITEYESETSFDQVIKIKPITNPLLVFIDPNAQELDKSDAQWGFVFEDISREQCKRDYPNVDPESWAECSRGWVQKDTVRIAEYFYCEFVDDIACMLDDGSTGLKSELPESMYDRIVKERKTLRKKWKWCKLVGGEDKPVEESDWPGSFLPIVSVVGKEVNVNGEIVRKGIVRDLKDPARMVNFSYSEAIQTVALQNKIPYIAPAEAVEGYEDEWRNANTSNKAYLPYNAYDDEGNPIPRPERQQPAVMPAAQVQMLQLSTEQMRAASGQQNANFGIRSEASSGVGIQRLKAQGEIATFHFPDNQMRGLRYEAKVLIDLIPKVLDTRRVERILGVDGKDERVLLDPQMPKAYAEEKITPEDIQKIFNPMVGKYDVAIDTGPSFQTQRQEASQVMAEVASRDPRFMQIAGDLFWRAIDVPMSDQLAKRYEKTIPPELQKDKEQQIPPQVQQQMQQMEETVRQLDGVVQKMSEELESKDIEREKLEVDKYKAETERMSKLGLAMQPEQVQALVIRTLREIAATNIVDEEQSSADMIQQQMMQRQMPEEMQQMQPDMQQIQPEQAPPGAFFTPEQ